MPIVFLRHAATGKNIEGGTDDPATPLHPDGVAQASRIGPRLLALARHLGVRAVVPFASGHVRASRTWQIASQSLAGSGLDVAPLIEDTRIGEIRFLPREFRPTPDEPGLFGRVIDGTTLPGLLEVLRSFDAERLRPVPSAELAIVVGHRSTTRVLAMVHAGQTLDWVEALPRMNNCELWLATAAGVECLHPGYASARDEADFRRSHLPTRFLPDDEIPN